MRFQLEKVGSGKAKKNHLSFCRSLLLIGSWFLTSCTNLTPSSEGNKHIEYSYFGQKIIEREKYTRDSRNTPHEGSTEIETSRILEVVCDACILRAFVSAAETRDYVLRD